MLYTRAGPEIGVAATKTYVSQLTCIYLLGACIGDNKGLLKRYRKSLADMSKVFEDEDHIIEIAKKYKDSNYFFFIGRGFSYPTALEGALNSKR